MSIPSGIGAIGSAASTPNWLLCCVVREGTSWGNDAWRRWRQNMRKRSKKWQFLHDAIFLHQSIMAVNIILRPLWGHAPGNKAYNNQQTYYSKGQHYFYDYFWHDALTNCCAQSLPVVMVIRPTQSVGGNNSGTYTLYMSPLMAPVLGLAHWPWLGPRQLMVSDY
jgi:hypothetical protein